MEDDNQIRRDLQHIGHDVRELVHDILHPQRIPTGITFHEVTMNPTAAGQTQVFTGTLIPAGAIFPPDSTFSITSNDPAVTPVVDSTGLVVTVTYPQGWAESSTVPLAFSYTASSASTGMSISATINPSAPPAPVPTGIAFSQTQ